MLKCFLYCGVHNRNKNNKRTRPFFLLDSDIPAKAADRGPYTD